METKFLENLGLTKGECKVYIALLELGPSTTGQIIKVAGVSRSKVYEMLEKLIKNGLVSYTIRENTKYYDTTNPKLLNELLKKKESYLARQRNILNHTISMLEKKRGSRRPQQTAVVYEGKEGIRTIYKSILEILKPGDEYYAFQVDPEKFKDDFVDFIRNYHRHRAKKKIKVRLLCLEETRQNITKAMKGIPYTELRFTSRPLPTSAVIFGDRIATFVWGDDSIGVVMISRIIAARYKKFFLYLWNTAKK